MVLSIGGIILVVSLVINILLLVLFLEQRRIITTDIPTGLLNKVGLFEVWGKYDRRRNSKGFWKLDRRKNNKSAGAVLYIDLDKFKPVNDKYGHHVGDILIVEFSKFLKEHIRSKDTPARLHGDEFVVILQDVNEGEAKKIASNIVEKLTQRTFNVHGHEINLSATVGVATAKNHKEPFNFDLLIKEADRAMLESKQDSHDR